MSSRFLECSLRYRISSSSSSFIAVVLFWVFLSSSSSPAKSVAHCFFPFTKEQTVPSPVFGSSCGGTADKDQLLLLHFFTVVHRTSFDLLFWGKETKSEPAVNRALTFKTRYRKVLELRGEQDLARLWLSFLFLNPPFLFQPCQWWWWWSRLLLLLFVSFILVLTPRAPASLHCQLVSGWRQQCHVLQQTTLS